MELDYMWIIPTVLMILFCFRLGKAKRNMRPFYGFLGIWNGIMIASILIIKPTDHMIGIILSVYYFYILYSLFIINKLTGREPALMHYLIYPIPIGCMIYVLLTPVYFAAEIFLSLCLLESVIMLIMMEKILSLRKEIITDAFGNPHEIRFWKIYPIILYYAIGVMILILFPENSLLLQSIILSGSVLHCILLIGRKDHV